jgi:branched-chain amino acid transport system substrate-binding protein
MTKSTAPRRRLSRSVQLTVASTVVGLVLSACGSDKASTNSTTAAAASGGSSSSNQAAFKILFLAAVKGETQNGSDEYWQADQLAMEAVNKAGGVNGKPVEFSRLTIPSDAAGMSTALLKAAESKPDLIITAAEPTFSSVGRTVDQVGIPIIGQNSYAKTNGYPGGSKWTFQDYASDSDTASGAAKYATDGLSAKKIALLFDTEPFGKAGSDVVRAFLKTNGTPASAESSFDPNATDLTQAILAAKGADAIVNWSYPVPLAAQVNTMDQQGSLVPTVSAGVMAYDVSTGLIHKSAFPKVFSAAPCNPQGSTQPSAKDFLAAYTAKFGGTADSVVGLSYDAVLFGIAAAKGAKSYSPDDLRASMLTTKLSTGVCTNDLHSDKTQALLHDITIVGFDATGAPVTKASYHFPDATS